MQQRAITGCGALLLVWALLLVPLPGAAASAQDAAREQAGSERPNIVLILADDLGYSDISPYGSEIDTPTLQRLAEGGMRLTQVHNTSKCFTTRAQLLAGAYAQQIGMADGPGHFENAVMLGEVLGRAGYRTLFVGKHHGTDNPYRWGFDHYYGLRDGAANYFNPGEKRPFDPGEPAQKPGHYPRTFAFDDSLAAPYTPPEGYYSTDTWTTWALDLLKQREDEAQPFFLYLAYQAPHDPLQAPPETIQKYEGAYDEGYAAVRQARYERLVASGLIDKASYPLSEATHRDWERLSDSTKADQARRMEVYAAMIDRMDQNIGRVVDYLEARGELENTLILFASDNGASAEVVRVGEGPIGSMTRWASLGADWANVGNTPFRYYKNYSYQGGVATPFIAYWPGVIAPGTTSDYVGRLFDLMPTLAEITGATYPEAYRGRPVVEMQGQSLVPLFKGASETRRDGPLYWKWADGRAVYRDGWKLVAEGDSSAWELYDLYGDRTETRDLAPRTAPLAEELARSWQTWDERTTPYRMPEDSAWAVKERASAAGASGDSAAAAATAAAAAADWQPLFDGETLEGWHNPYDWGEAWVEDGEIRLRAEKKFFLVTDQAYSDFVFEGEVHVPDTSSNSGFMVRANVEPNRVYGYQAEVDPSARQWAGGLYDEGRRGWLHPAKGDEAAGQAFREGPGTALDPASWNEYRIRAEGDSLWIWVNGERTTAYRDTVDSRGVIGIQHHGEAGKVYRFRNLRLQPLGGDD